MQGILKLFVCLLLWLRKVLFHQRTIAASLVGFKGDVREWVYCGLEVHGKILKAVGMDLDFLLTLTFWDDNCFLWSLCKRI